MNVSVGMVYKVGVGVGVGVGVVAVQRQAAWSMAAQGDAVQGAYMLVADRWRGCLKGQLQ